MFFLSVQTASVVRYVFTKSIVTVSAARIYNKQKTASRTIVCARYENGVYLDLHGYYTLARRLNCKQYFLSLYTYSEIIQETYWREKGVDEPFL